MLHILFLMITFVNQKQQFACIYYVYYLSFWFWV